MRRFVVLLALGIVFLGGCATFPSSTPLLLSAQPTVIVLATAIIAPEHLVVVVVDAVKSSPEFAVAIAAAATTAAPDQASAIRAAVIPFVPWQADAIIAATKVRRGAQAVTRLHIPKHDDILALVEQATR